MESFDDYSTTGFDAFLMANPVTGTVSGGLQALSQAQEFIKQLVSQFETAFGIGAGRREADLITPYQNQLVSPPNQPLGIINTAYYLAGLPEHNNPDDLNQIYQITFQAISTFNRYIDAPLFQDRARWPDGRASKQAYATVKPYEDDVLAFLKRKLIDAGGVLHAIPPIVRGGSVGGALTGQLEALTDVDQGTTVGGMSAFRSLGGSQGMLLFGGVVLVVILVAVGGRSQ